VCFKVGRLPPSLNTMLRTHWRRRAEEQRDWDELIGCCWVGHHRFVFQHPVELTYILSFALNRQRDRDNYIGGTKYITDALKRTFFFRDDAEWIRKIEVIFAAAPREGTEIIITSAGQEE
jgi:hypothetical protein